MSNLDRFFFLQSMLGLGGALSLLLYFLSTDQYLLALPFLVLMPIVLIFAPWPKYVFTKFNWMRKYLFIYWPLTFFAAITLNYFATSNTRLASGLLGLILLIIWIRRVHSTRLAIFGDQQSVQDSVDDSARH